MDNDTDRAQIARFGEQPPLEALPVDDDAPPAPLWLRAVLAAGAVCIAVAIVAAVWGRV